MHNTFPDPEALANAIHGVVHEAMGEEEAPAASAPARALQAELVRLYTALGEPLPLLLGGPASLPARPPCPYCHGTAHAITLAVTRHVVALQQQVAGLAAEKALLLEALAQRAPATEEAYAGREETEIGLSYADTDAALKRLATVDATISPAQVPGLESDEWVLLAETLRGRLVTR